MYGGARRRSKAAECVSADPGGFTYPGDSLGVKPVRSRVGRVNSRLRVDGSGSPGRDSKGDAAHVF
ncbi:hypothetical protein GCM10010423_35310 [Streptomyces levis]|uniref:Uncharacterized protein n=1 Tax=Streptomyces levis TaxID=285566 RepID=A0ABP6B3F9_9ACTN